MSTSDNADTFAQQVNNIVSQATVDDSGNLQLPDGVEASEEVLYAAKIEKRARDTQSAFTKAQQERKRLEAENEKLAMSWQQDAVKNLSSTEQARLEELKSTDPEAWRDEMNSLEQKRIDEFNERRQGITKEAQEMTELELREAQLEAYNKANPEFAITDEVIENDIPPRITNKLKNGDITFEEFLEQSKKYIETPKKIKTEEAPGEPNFAGTRNKNAPTEEDFSKDFSATYNNTVF